MKQSISQGEVSGAFLIGMVESFSSTYLLPEGALPFEKDALSPEGWYPYDYLIELNELIETQIPGSDSILFWAGVRFIELWYWHGPGKEMIQSSLDWVYCHDDGGGYNSVVRGETIGWSKSRVIDEAQGFALIENVMPLTPAYLRGIFFGGMYLFDDMAYFNAEIESIEDDPNWPFQCTVIRLTFKPTINSISTDRQQQIQTPHETDTVLSPTEAQEVLWRYRHQLNLAKLRTDYLESLGALTDKVLDRFYKLKHELAMANRQLTSEATTDELTGLKNKRHFYQEADKLLDSAKRDGHPVAALMMDIDYFKKFNDEYGHLAGDKALQAVAQSINQHLSARTNLVARFGGEEFVALLKNVDEATMGQQIENILHAVKDRQIDHQQSPVSAFLTVSVGSVIAQVSTELDRDLDELLEQADIALYRAKAQGRNCHVHFKRDSAMT